MRPLIYGNGSLLVCVDERGIVRDFYYPHAGMENHGGYMRLGLYDLGAKRFAWLENWKKTQAYLKIACRVGDRRTEALNMGDRRAESRVSDLVGRLEGRTCIDGRLEAIAPGSNPCMAEAGDGYTIGDGASMIGDSTFADPAFGAAVTVSEMVHHEKDLFLRTIAVANTSAQPRAFRLFSAQNYHILENNYANTAVRDGPMMNHYKRNRFFVQGSRPAFDQFSAGVSEWGDKLGTWKDAEDGVLEGNVVAHGTVDSAVGWTLPELAPGESSRVHFWVCVGQNFREARDIHGWIREQDIDAIYNSSGHYWSSFCVKAHSRGVLSRFPLLPRDVREAFTRSLLTVAAHIDQGGSIIASCDSQIKQQGADYYTYCWPRDAAWVAVALDRAGYRFLCRNTYGFFARIVDRKGFFRHKYTPSGDLGSTWHPLPMIQVDETGLPLYAVYRHWLEDRNVMTISGLYEPLIKPAADFLVRFIDRDTGLPKPSFDLWEERKGVYTYSCACVYAGLASAASIAALIGDPASAAAWSGAARGLQGAAVEQLYDPALGRFRRGIGDDTVDASLFATWYLGLVPPGSEAAAGTMRAIEEKLTRPSGGIARYEGDRYQGYMNSWPLCTLWLAQWYTRSGQLDRALSLLRWSLEHAAPGGLMPEQVGDRGEPVSVLPLAWSHSTFMLATIEYLEALTCRETPETQPGTRPW